MQRTTPPETENQDKTPSFAPDAHPAPEKESEASEDALIANPTVATAEQNAKLEHSEGGATTRDANDLGVPMLPGDPSERVGPEDALGPGPTRGDYRGRIGDASYQPHDGATPQRPRTQEIADVPGKKGGVETG